MRRTDFPCQDLWACVPLHNTTPIILPHYRTKLLCLGLSKKFLSIIHTDVMSISMKGIFQRRLVRSSLPQRGPHRRPKAFISTERVVGSGDLPAHDTYSVASRLLGEVNGSLESEYKALHVVVCMSKPTLSRTNACICNMLNGPSMVSVSQLHSTEISFKMITCIYSSIYFILDLWQINDSRRVSFLV